jgi:CheY-like chemotaxis protein
MQQVFLNLIVNAEQAMKTAHNGGELRITTERRKQKIRITFSDDGPGISRETMSHLFEPFYTTKGPAGGTGLGLSLSHSIVLEHGGEIWSESEEGHGATFIIELPITEILDIEGETKTNAVTVNDTKKTTPAKIMVIDDEQSILEYLQTVLTGVGYSITVCKDPAEALKAIDGSYDVILLDIRMPGMSGTDLYSHIIKKIPSLAYKVIFMTGDTSDYYLNDFLKKANMQYLSKPMNLDILKEKIRSILDKG